MTPGAQQGSPTGRAGVWPRSPGSLRSPRVRSRMCPGRGARGDGGWEQRLTIREGWVLRSSCINEALEGHCTGHGDPLLYQLLVAEPRRHGLPLALADQSSGRDWPQMDPGKVSSHEFKMRNKETGSHYRKSTLLPTAPRHLPKSWFFTFLFPGIYSSN